MAYPPTMLIMRTQQLILIFLCLVLLGGCVNSCPGGASDAQGVILISLDTLRADHLGAYGSERDTSPFFDTLAGRGILFEQAYIQYPSTLTSHMSIFTGLYPSEHGVFPPRTVLPESIGMLAEVMQQFGIRTCGATEGGLVSASYGFSRGFDTFADPQYRSDEQVEETFQHGLEFLRGLGPDDRFFLFLHTYAIHDPYAPPAGYSQVYYDGPPPADKDSNGKRLRAVNLGEDDISAEAVSYFEAEYDATIRYVDDVLKSFMTDLQRLGLAEKTVLVITSDHGEEFLEHGKLAHTQIYPECLHVPLLIVDPRSRAVGRRVPAIVESVDLAPTLIELMGLPPWQQPSGKSLVPLMNGSTRSPTTATAHFGDNTSSPTILARQGDEVFQLLVTSQQHEKEGTWIADKVAFDVRGPLAELEMRAFGEERQVDIAINDGEAITVAVGTRWQRQPLIGASSDGLHRITVQVDGCVSPQSLGRSNDRRCLGVFIKGDALKRRELFNLTTDPAAQADVSKLYPDLVRALENKLDGINRPLWGATTEVDLSESERAQLEALGYVGTPK